MREYQTLKKFDENVYLIDSDFVEDDIINKIVYFLKELISRKRDDPFEGGLQAGGIIFPNKSAFKISEKDGTAPHCHVFETLAQYIDGETTFSGIDTMGNIYARKDDPHSWLGINRIGFEVRILIGKDDLIMAITTNNNDISLFQLNVIEVLIKCIRILRQQGLLKNVSINYVTKEDRYLKNLETMKDTDFIELEDLLKERKNERKVL